MLHHVLVKQQRSDILIFLKYAYMYVYAWFSITLIIMVEYYLHLHYYGVDDEGSYYNNYYSF